MGRYISYMAGLSPLETEILLEKLMQKEKGIAQNNINRSIQDKFSYSKEFSRMITKVRNMHTDIGKELETPQIEVVKDDSRAYCRYNPDISSKVRKKLKEFEMHAAASPKKQKFAGYLYSDRDWVECTQVDMMGYICDRQIRYLYSGNDLDFKPLTQKNISNDIGISFSSVCRLLRRLTISLDQRIIFANELVPGSSLDIIRGTAALKELMQDREYYDSEWKIADHKLKAILASNYDVWISRRTVSKYRQIIKQQASQ